MKSDDVLNITTKRANSHPYPFLIAIQTQEYIQGAIFYSTIADMSSGAYFRQESALIMLERDFLSHAGEKGSWELGWMLLEKYIKIFEITVFQNVLVSINSYWDWYIRNLGNFVMFARKYYPGPTLNKEDENNLKRIGHLSICQQLVTLEKACNIRFDFMNEELEALKEMSLVRNLALHNRWEVDKIYLDYTSDKRFRNIGEIRIFDSSELEYWHKNMIKAIRKTSETIAVKYAAAPNFPAK